MALATAKFGWRSCVAAACAVLAGLSGPVSVDRYSDARNYILPVIFAVTGLAFAWRAIRLRRPEDRLMGTAAFVLLSLFCLYMLYDRLGVLAGWRNL